MFVVFFQFPYVRMEIEHLNYLCQAHRPTCDANIEHVYPWYTITHPRNECSIYEFINFHWRRGCCASHCCCCCCFVFGWLEHKGALASYVSVCEVAPVAVGQLLFRCGFSKLCCCCLLFSQRSHSLPFKPRTGHFQDT